MKALADIPGVQIAAERTSCSEDDVTKATAREDRRYLVCVALFVLVFGGLIAAAKNKEKPLLPDYVLKAQTVLVIIDPDAGTRIKDPQANKTAQDDVEKALMKWGRFRPVLAGMQPDLVITVRKGSDRIVEPVITGEPTNDRPVVVQQTDNGIHVGGQTGHPTDQTQTPPQDTRPKPGMEAAPTEDFFVVYDGSLGPNPDGPPVWHYSAKNALRSPDVPAVAEFRKVFEAALKQQQKQKKSNP